ncbi:MAG: DUF2817 domain-containing protein [Ilumatobacteraceae bacterium]
MIAVQRHLARRATRCHGARRRVAACAGAIALLATGASCSSTSSGLDGAAAASSTVLSTSTSTTASTSSTSTSTTTTTEPLPPDFLGEQTIGTSVEGRPLTAWHRGTSGGVVMLVVGVIHGDEDAGLAILDEMTDVELPPNLDLWVLPAINPDGVAHQVRGNAHGVDLNRNFPHDWGPIAEPGDWEYAGTGPASEPETAAFVEFATQLRPTLTLWYHQDLYCITPSKGRDRLLRLEYSQRSGLPVESVTGGTYTGVAATWVRTEVSDAMSFIVELGPTVPADELVRHVDALLAVGAMLSTGDY